jgi:hypothetical protein
VFPVFGDCPGPFLRQRLPGVGTGRTDWSHVFFFGRGVGCLGVIASGGALRGGLLAPVLAGWSYEGSSEHPGGARTGHPVRPWGGLFL